MSAAGHEIEDGPREDRSRRLWALFDHAADLPPAEQRALLDTECADDPALRAEVERLLANDARLETPASGFLRSPVVRDAPEPTDRDTPSHPAEVPRPTRLGRYRLVRLLGAGGMGAVYEAEQDSPRRTVALKIIRPGAGSSPLLQRFRHESQILGRLHHPGIAQVYEAGLADDGQPFFAMELVRGLPLDEYARTRSLTLADRLELLARVCDAVQHAHDQGIIHRDLKPANVLVEESGQPKVLDFGVARAIDADLLTGAGLTQTGQMLGTPNYMSPEQVTAAPGAVDHRADVYALGVILFELAAHRLPYRLENRTLVETARLIVEEDPPRLGTLDPELRGDVETIVAKALEKERSRRYASAADLAADIRRYLGHQPIQARPPSALYHLRKFTRRHRAFVGGVVATGVALVVGLVGTILFAVAETKARDQAEQNALAANREKQAALYQAYRASLAAANSSLQNNDVVDAESLLKFAPEGLRGWEWRHLQSRLNDSSAAVRLPDGGGFLIDAQGQVLIGALTSAGLRITDLEGVEQRAVPIDPKHRRGVSVCQTHRGLRVAAWVDDTAFDLLDEAGQVLCRVTVPDNKGHESVNVVVAPDGTRLACNDRPSGSPDRIGVFDATSGKRTAVCLGHQAGIRHFTFSPDGARVATCSEDHTARLWDAATGKLLATFKGHGGPVNSVAFSPDGARLVTASGDGTVRQWDARTGQEIERPYDRHRAILHTAVYSPDGKSVASAGEDRTIRVWRAQGLQDVAVLHGHTQYVYAVAFAAGGRRLVSRSSGDSNDAASNDWVRIWDVEPDATLPILRGHTAAIYPLAYSPDGRWLVSGSWDRTVRVLDAATGETCATLFHDRRVEGLAFGPDGTWLLTACNEDKHLHVWDVATARVLKEIPYETNFSVSVTVSPDGTRAAVEDFNWYSRDQRITVIDMAAGKSMFTTKGVSLAYSPDGRWLAATSEDARTVLLRDARTNETTARFSGHEKGVTKAAFSPDSRFLASCSDDRTVRLWQIDSGACRVLRGHTDIVYAVAFHPDGTRLATAARDGAVWLWDLERGEDLVRLRGHDQFVWSLAFSPDGATLASCSGDETVRLWDTAPLKARHQARRAADALRPEAKRRVEPLWRSTKDPARVADALRADRALSEPQRHAALRELLGRSQRSEAVTGGSPAPR
jgi:WD40 repeat protein